MAREDLTGRRFGKLTVLDYAGHDKYGNALWVCKCDCGNESVVISRSLIMGSTKSCGCLRRKHNLYGTRIYRIWNYIKHQKACICNEWNDFNAFNEWAMNNGYREDLSLGRIDVNREYCPKNCIWTDRIAILNNRRGNSYFTYNGETHTKAEWARILDTTQSNIQYMIKCNKLDDFEKHFDNILDKMFDVTEG